jgi:hypothetical protein
VATQLEYPLEIGVVTHTPTYDGSANGPIKRYIVKSHDYDITLAKPGSLERIGSAKVIQDAPEAFRVRLHFPIAFPANDARFWGAFSVDEDGVATLESIYLVVRH